ncbi:MAG: peptide-methionine (S)-S-oxide reductase MsrA [Hyphomonas sp.]|nr:peptide-methionine (S)-S-oxide reductase MsrA [Hyphomonas sp.]
MRTRSPQSIALVAGLVSMALGFFSSAGAQDQTTTPDAKRLSTAVFAGGCFWCMESDFDKLDGVVSTISGYTGGHVDNPTYQQVSHEDTGHYESVKVTYDPDKLSYDQLVRYYFHHVDPTDAGGQFCDRGESYRTAIFVSDDAERAVAEAEADGAAGELGKPVVTNIADATTFWPAETYHQDYYKKNPLKYRYYRSACGRDARVKSLWGADTAGH